MAQKALDESWYDEFASIFPRPHYDKLNVPLQQQERIKPAFLAGEIENPEFEYPELEDLGIFVRLNRFRRELSRIYPSTAGELYRDCWYEIDDAQDLLLFAQNGAGFEFLKSSKRLYGEPSAMALQVARQRLKEYVEAVDSAADDRIKCARDVVQPLAAENSEEIDVIGILRRIGIPEPQKDENPESVTADELEQIFLEALETAGSGIEWSIKVDDTRTGAEVQGMKQLIKIPSTEALSKRGTKLTRTRARALAAHEIGTHAVRYDHGLTSGFKLLAYGLPGYEEAEEGIAAIAERRIRGANEAPGYQHTLSLGLALGLFDGRERNFREVFNGLVAAHVLQHAKPGKPVNLERAQEWAWKGCVRIFRGTRGMERGVVFTKDCMYANGFWKIAEVITQDPSIEKLFPIGKFDPTDPEHTGPLRELGII